ncbi:uncharacterized protein LOC131668125 isoform X2 [Phymastichus coffea]|uniref:uncharacterized protein LOC131668125 isoform X2 n=1 Tax=Phymastichus coffea TaxID=108790 RepID=UPI00273C2A48|nr:uncharacterized protein LOC131668125 isoform X2 [Phymastichus coffea]
MTSPLALLGLIVLVFAVGAVECRAVPDTNALTPLMPYFMRNPLMIVRDKRGYYQGYPPRTMMFTGFYRPPRRSGSNSQATSIYTEGNAIGGGAYFSQPVYLGGGPDPANDVDMSSSVAEAHPGTEYDESDESAAQPQDNEKGVNREQLAQKSSKGQKKDKNVPIDEEYNDEYDDEDEEYHKRFKPRGREYKPANNYFPMVFSFPGFSGRRASATSGLGGPVTAIANSYSTSKGGVASSVATAYGDSPTKKPWGRYSSKIN